MTATIVTSLFKKATSLCFVGLSFLGNSLVAQHSATPEMQHTKAVLTRFEVKTGQEKAAHEALTRYVQQALGQESNIMAEAYYEQEHPSTLWLIERWQSKAELNKMRSTDKLELTAAATIYITDLEPLSRKEWRRTAAATDTPITIMLFVDSKPGTENTFREVYHTAMPQFRSEPGVINYQLSQLVADSSQFVTYEKFRNEAAFQYHLNFPPIQPVIDYLHTSIKSQPFQKGLHRLIAL